MRLVRLALMVVVVALMLAVASPLGAASGSGDSPAFVLDTLTPARSATGDSGAFKLDTRENPALIIDAIWTY